jgi:hypothetical protein
MNPAWWAMPAQTKAERAARQAAKAIYCDGHPLTESRQRPKAPTRVKGGLLSASGVFYAARTPLEKQTAAWLAQLPHDPIPACLRLAEEDGKPVFVGTSGRRYPAWLIAPRSFAVSLDFATREEQSELAARERERLYANEQLEITPSRLLLPESAKETHTADGD